MTSIELPALYIGRISLIADSPRLALINRDPCPGETGVPIDPTIALEIVDIESSDLAHESVRVWIDDDLAFDGRNAPGITPGFAGALSEVASSADMLRIVLHPLVPLASLAVVTVRVVAQTTDGAAVLDEVYAFTIEDRTAPRLVAAQATGQRTLRLGFDEPVLLSENASFVIKALGAPAVPVTVTGMRVENSVVELTLDTEMTPDIEHDITAAGLTDLAGNEILAPFDRARFSGFRPPMPPTRRFSLWEMLPKHNRRDDLTGDLARFIACLQEVTDLLLADADRWPDIFDLERAPEPFLDLLLRDLGNPFPFELDVMGKRRLASVLVEMYRQKGTAKGIQNAIRFFLGIDISAITPWAADTLVLGESELGVDWVLGPSERFARYAFNVEVARILSKTERRRLRAIVEYLKPAHTHFVDLVEPLPPIVPDHWELGLSELGETTVLH